MTIAPGTDPAGDPARDTASDAPPAAEDRRDVAPSDPTRTREEKERVEREAGDVADDLADFA